MAEQIGDAHARARCETALAEEARRQGRFDEAAWLLASAADAFGAVDDEAGVGQVHHLAGTLAAQQGAYDDALRALRGEPGDPRTARRQGEHRQPALEPRRGRRVPR